MNLIDWARRPKGFLGYVLSPLRAYSAYVLLATLFFAPVLLAGTDYIDDNARRVSGYYDWASLGRFFTEALMHILTFSGPTMADPGRLMQILSIPTLAGGAYVFARAINNRSATRSPAIKVAAFIVALPLVFNPFLLANYAFRYDSFSMILAYSLAIAAACLVSSSAQRVIGSVVIVFVVAALYQPMIMVFVVTTLLLWLYRWLMEEPRSHTRAALSFVVFAIASTAYFITLKLFHFSNIGGDSRGILVPLNRHGADMALQNFINGLNTISLLFANGAGKFIAGLLILGLITGVGTVVYVARRSNWYEKLIAPITVVIGLVMSIMGPFILMDSALTYQVRTLSAAIGVVVLVGLVAFISMRRGVPQATVVGLGVVLLFSAYVLSLSYSFGNALVDQRRHDAAVYDEIDDYLLNDSEVKSAKLIYIGGTASRPESIDDIILKRPLLGKMELANDNSTWYVWMRLRDDRVSKANIQWYTQSKEEELFRQALCEQAGADIFDHPYFSVYRSEEIFVIWQHSSLAESDFCPK